jgi:dihydroorotate dehydrogenase
LQKLEAAWEKIVRLERIASNKEKAAEKAWEVVQRKVQRAYNKAHGIVIHRPKKDTVVIDD